MSRERTDLMQGTLELLILNTLARGEMHGYGIVQRIHEAAEDLLKVEDGSLYPALYRMEERGWIKSEWDNTPPSERPSEILVDVIGIGAGVCDRLAELKLPARGINVSETPSTNPDRYANMRAELWFKGRDWLHAKDCFLNGDDSLGAELVAPRFKYTSNGKILVESKDDMKKRGIPSPNKADAFLLTLASESVSLVHGSKSAASWAQPLQRKIIGIV